MKSLLQVLLDNSNYGRISLLWNIKREIAEHKYDSEIKAVERTFNDNPRVASEAARQLVEECPYLESCFIRIESLHSFLNATDELLEENTDG